ncbi:hypothetical protein AO381_0540 [Moraxella catarrhalis]|nr:hypothetical protein AO381_0540 [Moraxella catarrhalis]
MGQLGNIGRIGTDVIRAAACHQSGSKNTGDGKAKGAFLVENLGGFDSTHGDVSFGVL